MNDIGIVVKKIFAPVIGWLINLGLSLLCAFLIALIFVVLYFFLRYKINPAKATFDYLVNLDIRNKYYNFFRWVLVDMKFPEPHGFNEYGVTFYVGRQGAGKTLSMVEYAYRMKLKYPDCIIITNFTCKYSDYIMTDWHDFLRLRNSVYGAIFIIDEAQNEYSSEAWRDFPEDILKEISQQRKQRIKILLSSQYYSRCAKQLREQAFEVIQCKNFMKRFCFCRVYDSEDYTTDKKALKKVRPLRKYSYVIDNGLRKCYDTYEKVERMKKVKFIDRKDR